MSLEEHITICAVRYALGRMTYIVSVVCEYVEAKKDELSEQCKAIIVRDIQEEYDFCHRLGKTLGMEYDEQNWMCLLEILKGGAEHE